MYALGEVEDGYVNKKQKWCIQRWILKHKIYENGIQQTLYWKVIIYNPCAPWGRLGLYLLVII